MAYYIMYSITKEIENNTLNKKGKLVHMANNFLNVPYSYSIKIEILKMMV